jgi:hypothetical protein
MKHGADRLRIGTKQDQHWALSTAACEMHLFYVLSICVPVRVPLTCMCVCVSVSVCKLSSLSSLNHSLKSWPVPTCIYISTSYMQLLLNHLHVAVVQQLSLRTACTVHSNITHLHNQGWPKPCICVRTDSERTFQAGKSSYIRCLRIQCPYTILANPDM